MEKIIFFGLVIPIFLFVLYLGGRSIMTGFGAKSSNKSESDVEINNDLENIPNNPERITEELEKLNELLKSGALTQEEFEKAKNKILND